MNRKAFLYGRVTYYTTLIGFDRCTTSTDLKKAVPAKKIMELLQELKRQGTTSDKEDLIILEKPNASCRSSLDKT